jgi:TP901 family phage tail tape measure protein
LAILEARAVITAADETAKGFDSVRARLAALDRQISGVTKSISAVDQVDKSIASSAGAFGVMENSIRQVAAASKGLGGEFDRLQAAQAKLGAFKSLSKDFAAARQAFNETRNEVARLGRELRTVEAPAKALERQQEAAKVAATEASKAYNVERLALEQLRAEKASVASTGGAARQGEAPALPPGAGGETDARIEEQQRRVEAARSTMLAAQTGQPAAEVGRQEETARAAADATKAFEAERAALERLKIVAAQTAAPAPKSVAGEMDARIEAQEKKVLAARDAMRGARAEASLLTKQFTEAQGPLSILTRQYGVAQKEVENAAKAFDSQKTALVGLKSEFESLAGPMTSISSAEARLASDIERANAELREQGIIAARTADQVAAAARREEQAARRRAERIEALKSVGAFGGVMLAHEAERVGVDVIKTYRDFDKERRFAQAVMGITDEEQKPLVDQAIHGGGTTKFNDIQFLEAQRELAARGLKIDQILGLIPAGADFGMATDQDLPSSVRQIEAGVFGFKKDTSTREAAIAAARRTADLMTKAAKTSGMTPEDEVELYKRGANPAHMAHVSEETLLAFGGTLKRANIGGDEASTAFRALIAASLSPTSGAKTALLANGLDFSKYQHMRDHLDLDPFVRDVAQRYGVKLDKAAQTALGKVFSDKELIADPAKFTPAVMRTLSSVLGGADAKSKKSIAGEANRYRAASASGVDVDALIVDLMKKLPNNLALANALFGAKQGGRIATALGDPETFNKILAGLKNESEGYAEKIAKERMAGFDGAMSKLEGAAKNVFTSIGRAWDDAGKGGMLTAAANAAAKVTQSFAELNGVMVRTTSGILGVAAAIAGAWGSFRIAKTLLGITGSAAGAAELAGSAVALDTSAAALDASAAALSSAAARLGVPLPGGAPQAEKTATATAKAAEGYAGWKAAQQVSPIKGPLSRFLGAAGEAAGRLAGPLSAILVLRDIGELANPTTPQGAPYRFDTAWKTQREDVERSMRAEREMHQGADFEAARGRAMVALETRDKVEVGGSVQIENMLKVEAGSDLLRIVDQVKKLIASIPVSDTGRSTAGVAPNGSRWDR